MQLLILLSSSQALISNIIYEGEQSFNPPSTPSQLTFAHPRSFFHHHFHPPHLKLPRTTPEHPPASPSPQLRDVGSFNTASAPSEARLQPQLPLLFPKGCGREGGGNEGAGEGETRRVRRAKQGGEGEEHEAVKEREITMVGGPNRANPTQRQPTAANSAQR